MSYQTEHQGDPMRGVLILSTAAALSAAGILTAQTTTAKPDSTCTKFSDGRVQCRVYRRIFTDSAFGNGNAIFMRMDSAMSKRAALGIELRATGTRRDTLGVFVEGVTPKGPAETAGIIEGDRIAAINGVELRTPAGDIDDPYSNGMASHRISREVQKLTPGSRVTLRVFSNGRFRDVQVVAGKATDLMRLTKHFDIGGPGGEMGIPFEGPGGMMEGPRMEMMRYRTPLPMRGRIDSWEREPQSLKARRPGTFKTLMPAPPPPPELYDIDDVDDDPDEDIPPVTADEIRELVAAAARDVAPALKQLAADGVA
jgi:hypothetical protein